MNKWHNNLPQQIKLLCQVPFPEHVLRHGHCMCAIETPFKRLYFPRQIICICFVKFNVTEISFGPPTEIRMGQNLVLLTALNDGSCRKSLVTLFLPPYPRLKSSRGFLSHDVAELYVILFS